MDNMTMIMIGSYGCPFAAKEAVNAYRLNIHEISNHIIILTKRQHKNAKEEGRQAHPLDPYIRTITFDDMDTKNPNHMALTLKKLGLTDKDVKHCEMKLELGLSVVLANIRLRIGQTSYHYNKY